MEVSVADLKEGTLQRHRGDSQKSTKSLSSNSSGQQPGNQQEEDIDDDEDGSQEKKKKKNKKRKIIRTVAVQTGCDEVVVDLVKFVKIKKTVDCGVQTELEPFGRGGSGVFDSMDYCPTRQLSFISNNEDAKTMDTLSRGTSSFYQKYHVRNQRDLEDGTQYLLKLLGNVWE